MYIHTYIYIYIYIFIYIYIYIIINSYTGQTKELWRCNREVNHEVNRGKSRQISANFLSIVFTFITIFLNL